MDDDDPPPPLAVLPRTPAPGQATSPSPASRPYRPPRHPDSRLSTSSSITTLPEYTTAPPARAYGRSFGAMQDAWPAQLRLEEADPLPDYKSPPASRQQFHRPQSSISKLGGGADFPPPADSDLFTAQYAPYSPRSHRLGHRYQSSTSTTRSADEELDAHLDHLVERSVAALEMSNRLLSGSSDRTSSGSPSGRMRAVDAGRGRRRERVGMYAPRRWVDEHIMEEDEDEDESVWEDTTFTGSLPEQSYLSSAYRPTLARMSSYGSIGARSTSEPMLDGYQFPRPQHPYDASHLQPGGASPLPSTPRTLSRSSSMRTTRPAPLNLASADLLGAPQVSTPEFHPSTPAYKLVSSIVSREALQRRTPLSGSQASGSQPSTPIVPTLGLPLTRPTSATPRSERRDSSAEPPKHRRKGTLTASVSVPQDIGRWIRSLESTRSPPKALTESEPASAAAPEIISPIPRTPKVINPELPPSPPRLAVSLPSAPSEPTQGTVPMSRSISQLRAILSSQPAPAAPPSAAIKRPQFRPVTPQVPSTYLTRPPPTPRSESAPPLDQDPLATSQDAHPSPQPSPAPSALHRFKSTRSKHVSFSPTPTEIPSRATSPPPAADDPVPAPAQASTGYSAWSLASWLLHGSSGSAGPGLDKKDQKKKKSKEDEDALLWRSRSWMPEGRQGWNERMTESWQV